MVTVIVVASFLIIFLVVFLFLQQPQFGSRARGERKTSLEKSPNFRNGQFQNLTHTPALTEGKTYSAVMREYFFAKKPKTTPPVPLQVVKSDLHTIDPLMDCIVWFGHSSYMLQIDGKKFLVDPVLSGFASPMPGMVRSFKGTNAYSPSDLPDIDYLIITHDHYDHLDHRTLVDLKPKIRKVITGLGVGAHLERWGYSADRIIEADWFEEIDPENSVRFIATPSRHFSGRSFKRNVTLWTSFVLDAGEWRIFIGGDSGYDNHFKEIGEKYGPFDIAILENGQYHDNWKYIHMTPEECVAAAIDLRAKQLLPVHWSKFSLAMHTWDDSIRRVVAEAKIRNVKLLHPRIGQVVNLQTVAPQDFYNWWENIE